jgi:hypothetical protein
VPDFENQEARWERSLAKIGIGCLPDYDYTVQLLADYTVPDDLPMVIDLDRIGTDFDYDFHN